MKIRLSLFLLVLALIVPCLVQAADQEEPTIYVIKQGDTLWGLSERFIKDPKYWPDMWSTNSQITNPHLIYPGQKVRIFADRIEIIPKEPAAETATGTPAAPAVSTEIFQNVAAEKTFTVRGHEGFLLEKGVNPFGKIINISNNRVMAGDDDVVYTDIGRVRGVKGGEKFSIYRSEGLVSHPKTEEIMGSKIIPLGVLQLTDLEQKASRAIITKSYREINAGSFLIPYREGQRHEVSLKMPTRDLKGYIVDSYFGTNVLGTGDVIYVDLGTAQGVEAGNLLYIVRDVTLDRKFVEGRVDRLPQELLGAVVILEPGRKTSSAIVVKSIDAIYKGDRIISLAR